MADEETAAIARLDPQSSLAEIQNEAHKLLANAGTFGARQVQELASQLQKACVDRSFGEKPRRTDCRRSYKGFGGVAGEVGFGTGLDDPLGGLHTERPYHNPASGLLPASEIDRLSAVMHKNITHNKCHDACSGFAATSLHFLRAEVP